MKKLYKIVACFLLLITVSLPIDTVHASQESQPSNLDEYINKIVTYIIKQAEVTSIQEVLDAVYSENSLNGVTQTYCLGLRGLYKDLNYTSYINSLTSTLKTEDQWKNITPQTFQKHALVYEALSSDNPLLSYAKENTMGVDGIMSYIFGLFLLEANGEKNEDTLSKELVYGLIAYQLEDGGFAYTGDKGDVDVTSFALQALAPFVTTDKVIKESVDRALLFLSKAQLKDGDFENFGAASSDSTAQVMLALCALDIDYTSDTRFIKDNHNVFDGLIRYQLADGSFAHTLEDQSNNMSTAQCLSALVALNRYEKGQCFLYQYGDKGYDNGSSVIDRQTNISYKWIITGAILLLLGLYAVIFAGRNKKRLLGTFLVSIILLLATWLINIQSPEQYYSKKDSDEITAPVKVSVAIRCDTVAGKADFIPKDGVILPEEVVTVQKGATALDVLLKVTAEHKIQMEYKDAGYVEGIGFLYEFKYGDLSGWLYKINGNFQSKGAWENTVHEGDQIIWVYSCNLGKDLGD